MEKIYGNHRGIVAQNNDPKQRGRIKVFVPHISANIYEGWDNKNADKSFDNLADPIIKDIINNVRDVLPWANCASPIVGEVGDHYYDSFKNTVKFGDSSDKSSDKPAKGYEDSPLTDEFGNSYSPSSYSNATKGLFSVPKVGAKVWVFFEDGDANRPVYFAASYDSDDWDGVSDDTNYPDKFENAAARDNDGSSDTYQNKLVVSQKGGVIEIINTDNEESVKITHYKGSFKVWNNDEVKEFVEGDDNKLVKGEQNITVKKDQNLYVGGNMNITVIGNANINVTQDCNITSGTTIDMAAPNIALHGIILLDGPLTQGTVGIQGATMQGPLTVIDEVTGNGIELSTHIHAGDGGSGSGPDTGPPIA